MVAGLTRAIIVHADGRVENLPEGEAAGRWVFREDKCRECGHVKGKRKYVIHFASNINTTVDGRRREGAIGPTNAGVLVAVEEEA